MTWATDHLRTFPWREEGLTRYQVVIAEVLLKRTTATAAARVYPSFVAQFPDLKSLAEGLEEDLEQSLAPLGLYRQRARGLKQMARYLLEQHGGQVPGNLQDLQKVPHLGPYASRAVLSFAVGTPAAIVDSNVSRVFGRLFQNRLGTSPTQRAIQDLADVVVDPVEHRTFNLAVLDLGAVVCRYDRPRCPDCPLAHLCDYAAQHP